MSKEQSLSFTGKQMAKSSQQNDVLHVPIKIDPKNLSQENKFLRKQNQTLRKQLENLSIRLDGEIKRRLQQQKKKQSTKVEDISQMQLQNAYKKCQIYKKEVSFYKKKLQSIPQIDRYAEYQQRISECSKQNQQLKGEIKHIKKISKLQQKGLAEIGAQGFIKLISEKEKLQEQVRILKKQIDDQRRGKLRSKHKTQTDNFNYNSVNKGQVKITEKDIKFQEQVKKRIRTQHNNQGSEEDLTEVLHQKVEKDFIKMKALMGEKARLREMVDNLKMQLSQRQKQISTLRQKISSLRKNNQVLQTQVNSRIDNYSIAQEMQDSSVKSKIRKTKVKLDHSRSKRRVWKKHAVSDGENDLVESQGNYPRVEERGSKMENTIKWNNENLSSKIKEIQVLLHESGHIKNIHAKYEKGQAKKYDGGKGKYMVLTCGDDEFVKYIQGCFYEDYLQYLIVTTSRKRVQKFGKWEQLENSEEGEIFEFQIKEGEFPGALFGENDQLGVRMLGCFIHKEL